MQSARGRAERSGFFGLIPLVIRPVVIIIVTARALRQSVQHNASDRNAGLLQFADGLLNKIGGSTIAPHHQESAVRQIAELQGVIDRNQRRGVNDDTVKSRCKSHFFEPFDSAGGQQLRRIRHALPGWHDGEMRNAATQADLGQRGLFKKQVNNTFAVIRNAKNMG